jgi:Fic family protein
MHRSRYYELLNRVRTDGDWESWLEFFAEAVCDTATQALQTAQSLHAQYQDDAAQVTRLGRTVKSVQMIHEAMIRHPLATPGVLVETTGLTPATVNKSLVSLVQLGIVEEITGKRRDRMFCYAKCFEILNAD